MCSHTIQHYLPLFAPYYWVRFEHPVLDTNLPKYFANHSKYCKDGIDGIMLFWSGWVSPLWEQAFVPSKHKTLINQSCTHLSLHNNLTLSQRNPLPPHTFHLALYVHVRYICHRTFTWDDIPVTQPALHYTLKVTICMGISGGTTIWALHVIFLSKCQKMWCC